MCCLSAPTFVFLLREIDCRLEGCFGEQRETWVPLLGREGPGPHAQVWLLSHVSSIRTEVCICPWSASWARICWLGHLVTSIHMKMAVSGVPRSTCQIHIKARKAWACPEKPSPGPPSSLQIPSSGACGLLPVRPLSPATISRSHLKSECLVVDFGTHHCIFLSIVSIFVPDLFSPCLCGTEAVQLRDWVLSTL